MVPRPSYGGDRFVDPGRKIPRALGMVPQHTHQLQKPVLPNYTESMRHAGLSALEPAINHNEEEYFQKGCDVLCIWYN